jgi:NADPH-dependent glutamate synthase beta subunit-like oxidoreductase
VGGAARLKQGAATRDRITPEMTAHHTPAADRKSVYRYDYRRARDQDARAVVRHPVVVVGAGPVGLAVAIDLA